MLEQEKHNKLVDHLPKTLISGVLVGFASKGFNLWYIITHIIVFSIGTIAGWLLHR